MTKSIKSRLLKSFVIVISISVSIVGIALVVFLGNEYYNSLELNLTNQVIESANLYNKYYADESTLEENILENVDGWWKNTKAQVEIVDKNGNVLLDSLGLEHEKVLKTKDIKEALKGKKGVWTGSVSYYSKDVMAVSYPLKSSNEIVGAIRFVSSLNQITNQIKSMIFVFLIFGLIVVIVVAIISLFLANSIIVPIEELTEVAKKMAMGEFDCRNEKRFDDEIGKLSDTLNYMAEEVLKKDNVKNDFLSQVSHELRTPLTIIKGWSSTLRYDNGNDNDMLIEGLAMIENESDRLTNMVEELLSFSKVLSGKNKLKLEMIQISEIIKNVQKMMNSRAIEEELSFEFNYEKKLPKIRVDKDKIKQVLINIIDNAFNFTKKGGIIKLSIINKGNYITITIKDNGSGINEKDISHIKEKFYKGKTSKSKNGLGLSICDEIVKLHGGKLEIESIESEGTTVYISLPVDSLNNN